MKVLRNSLPKTSSRATSDFADNSVISQRFSAAVLNEIISKIIIP